MLIVLLFILLIVSINDFLFFRIEDEYIVALFMLYLIYVVFGIYGENILYGLLVACLSFVVGLICNRYNLIGGGDVKYIVPLMLFVENNNNLFDFWFATSIASVFIVVGYTLFGDKIFLLRCNILKYVQSISKKSKILKLVLLSFVKVNGKGFELRKPKSNVLKQEIPYGIALSVGCGYVILLKFNVW